VFLVLIGITRALGIPVPGIVTGIVAIIAAVLILLGK
jgi:hypothetical protein